MKKLLLLLAILGSTYGAVKESHRVKGTNLDTECSPEDKVTYTGAVLEFEPLTVVDDDGAESLLMKNTLKIIEFAETAKSMGVDVFVTPEYSVQSLEMGLGDAQNIHYSQYVPDPTLQEVPCDDTSNKLNYEATKALSCAARNLTMYMVIDLAEMEVCTDSECPLSGYYLYNTQVVFDRQGAVIARYRKQNLYLERQFTAGPLNDSFAIFVTDFGVRFTLQICFDIVFQHPGYSNVLNEGVRDVVMSTAWVDEVPFLLAVNVQNSWSRSMGTNIMVSGYHWPERTKLGSGIYNNFGDMGFAYTFDENSGSTLVVSPVDSCITSELKKRPEVLIKEPQVISLDSAQKEDRDHQMLHEDLSVYNRSVLPTTLKGETNTVTLCHEDNLCCSVEYEHSSSNLTYQLMAQSGVLLKGGGTYQIYAQVCGIVWCYSEDWTTCALVDQELPEEDTFGPFTMSGTFSCEQVFPGAMTRNKTLVENTKLDVVIEGDVHTMTANEKQDSLMAAALFGRYYSKDP